MVASGCQALAVLTLAENALIREISTLGCVESIIASIRAQTIGDTEEALVSARKILRNLTQTEECRTEIYNSRGVEAVVEAMRKSGMSARKLSHSALLLSNIAFGNSQIKNAVGALGGIAAIAKGML